ncbi:hypothetical protein LX36DRAFT_660032 [Colletotrichum falcatum]|nr:hypothetical protein LX36DRAFT_660032 [Colletotrichum falcatum]
MVGSDDERWSLIPPSVIDDAGHAYGLCVVWSVSLAHLSECPWMRSWFIDAGKPHLRLSRRFSNLVVAASAVLLVLRGKNSEKIKQQ